MNKNKKNNVNKYANMDDISNVTGVKKSDRLLQVGTNFKFMKKYVKDSRIVESIDDVSYKYLYERIFVSADVLDEALIGKLGCICAGTITIFEEDDEKRAVAAQMLETKWFPADTWDLVSNVGKCLIATVRGPSQDWMRGYGPRD